MLAFIHINGYRFRKHEISACSSELLGCAVFRFRHKLEPSLHRNCIVAILLHIASYLSFCDLRVWHFISPGDLFRVAFSNSPVS